MIAFAALLLAKPGDIPPGLPKLRTIPGVSIRLDHLPKDNSPYRLRVTALNRTSKAVQGHNGGFWCNHRAFAMRLGGGPILTEKDWAKGFPCQAFSAHVMTAIKPHSALKVGDVDIPHRLNLSKGKYRVWVLSYDSFNGIQLVSNPLTIDVP
jgi:hypothetical protein